jgi:hypothetical protein
MKQKSVGVIQPSSSRAAGLAPTNNLEAAIATTLPPGLYTILLLARKTALDRRS